jgi:hypothetical protein
MGSQSDSTAEDLAEDLSSRQVVRVTAGKVLRSDDLETGEKDLARDFLQANPLVGNPHVVRCDWCHETRTLFRDENDGPFRIAGNGWRCEPCDERASTQEIRF